MKNNIVLIILTACFTGGLFIVKSCDDKDMLALVKIVEKYKLDKNAALKEIKMKNAIIDRINSELNVAKKNAVVYMIAADELKKKLNAVSTVSSKEIRGLKLSNQEMVQVVEAWEKKCQLKDSLLIAYEKTISEQSKVISNYEILESQWKDRDIMKDNLLKNCEAALKESIELRKPDVGKTIFKAACLVVAGFVIKSAIDKGGK